MYGLDLFSGIGGLTKALEGYVRPVAYCENDRYAQAVLLSRMSTRHIAKAPIWDDVTTLRGNQLPINPDIIYGGFPCQDISIAGRGAGLGGKRSGLFFEVARLIGEIRPAFVFLENVPAINRRGGDVVVGTLADLGYDARWDVLSAADVGAVHRRERWWLLAHATSKSGTGLSGGTEAAYSKLRERRSDVADAKGEQSRRICVAGVHEDTGAAGDGRGQTAWWSVEPNVGRVAHGVPQRVDRLRGLGNAVVPAQAREAFERLLGIKGGVI